MLPVIRTSEGVCSVEFTSVGGFRMFETLRLLGDGTMEMLGDCVVELALDAWIVMYDVGESTNAAPRVKPGRASYSLKVRD